MNIELERKCACRKRRGKESRDREEKRGATAGANAACDPVDDSEHLDGDGVQTLCDKNLEGIIHKPMSRHAGLPFE
jgi:hypothetical protein